MHKITIIISCAQKLGSDIKELTHILLLFSARNAQTAINLLNPEIIDDISAENFLDSFAMNSNLLEIESSLNFIGSSESNFPVGVFANIAHLLGNGRQELLNVRIYIKQCGFNHSDYKF